VATLDEALQLREAGIEAPILVLFPIPPDGAMVAARAGVEVSAGDVGLLERTLAAHGAARRRSRRGVPDLGVQLAVETGLERDGLSQAEVVEAAQLLAATPGASLRGLWSHLQAAADPRRTEWQLDRFVATLAALRQAGIEVPHRHVLNSGGLLVAERLVAGERPIFDGLRIGLAAYGIVPENVRVGPAAAGIEAALRPALSLHARPIRVVDLPAGVGISYGPSFVTSRPSRMATLPVGYGDGWSRDLSNRTTALVRGRRAPLVGSVMMDAVMADVTEIPGPPVTPADEFVLLGEQGGDAISAADLAQERTTISWEVVTAMSWRLPRVYTAGAVAVGLRTLTEELEPWRSSRSGTETSATWRSTRS
jgi:alanine racemase